MKEMGEGGRVGGREHGAMLLHHSVCTFLFCLEISCAFFNRRCTSRRVHRLFYHSKDCSIV